MNNLIKRRINNKGAVATILGFLILSINLKINNLVISVISVSLMFFGIIYSQLNEARNSIKECLVFLLLTSVFSSMLIAVLLADTTIKYLKISNINGDISLFIYIVLFSLIYLFFYALTIYIVENEVAKISIFIIATLITLIYTIASAALNYIPLTVLNDFVCKYISAEDIDYFMKNYDGRTFLNFLVQFITYPIWVVSMIGTVIIELKEYLRKKKGETLNEIWQGKNNWGK